MSILTCIDPDCQEEEIPFETGHIIRLVTVTPWENPLADLLAASYRNGKTDAAGADAAVMTYEEWVESVGPPSCTRGVHGDGTFEPEPSYFEDEV